MDYVFELDAIAERPAGGNDRILELESRELDGKIGLGLRTSTRTCWSVLCSSSSSSLPKWLAAKKTGIHNHLRRRVVSV